jgi:hypothetical protein
MRIGPGPDGPEEEAQVEPPASGLEPTQRLSQVGRFRPTFVQIH